MTAKVRRLKVLINKEAKQLLRDRLSLTIGLILPMVLLLIFGYGISMDIRNIKLAVVAHESSVEINQMLSRFQGSPYFHFKGVYHSTEEARKALIKHEIEACLYLPQDFARKLKNGEATVFLVVTAPNITRARMTQDYIQGIVAGVGVENVPATLNIESRMWFNDSNDSRYYLLPGVIVMIMTMIGALLTSLVVAREYEHGNFESLFISPIHPGEVLFAKALINFLLGMIGLVLILLASKFLFGIPFRGNLLVLVLGSALYLLVALGIGLSISSATKNQFVACQLTLVFTFMPALILSGFIYEINNMPVFLQWFTMLIPARYYVEFLQTIFLAGNVWDLLLKDLAILTLFGVIFIMIAIRKNPKSLE